MLVNQDYISIWIGKDDVARAFALWIGFIQNLDIV